MPDQMAGLRLRNLKVKVFQVPADQVATEDNPDPPPPDAPARLEAEYEAWRATRAEESFYDSHLSTTDNWIQLVVLYTD